jgi:long-chain acyl-CoA synthetase
LATLVRDGASRFADRIAFTTCLPNGMHGSLTFRQVDQLSDAFAAYLREVLKVEPETRIALQTPNCLAFPVVAFGVFKAGCVLVSINPLYTPAEMEQRLADSGAEVLVIVDMFANKLEEILPRTPIRTVIASEVTQFFSPLPRATIRLVMKIWDRVLPRIGVPHERLSRALESGAQILRSEPARTERYVEGQGPETLAVLQYTGGTTGVGKGAMLSHRNLLANLEQILAVERSYIDEGRECVLTALPLYHSFAFQINLLCFYAVGARNVLVPNPRPVRNLQRAFDNYPISWITGVNTLFNALLNEEWFTAFPPKHLKAAAAGGATLQGVVAERWESVTGSPIVEGYGLTEASPVVTFSPLTGERKLNSIGIPLPGTQVRLVDGDGRDVALGDPGELLVSGPQVMQGYWNRPDETKVALRNGWLHTGDIATVDEDGYYRIVDRMSDLILVSGFNVYPTEVEEVIARMNEVHEAAVIGVPDAETGEAVHAVVVPQGECTADAIRDHCRRYLAAYKVPRTVEFRSDMPKTPIGKILRRALRSENPH